jgi:hypothetical protein
LNERADTVPRPPDDGHAAAQSAIQLKRVRGGGYTWTLSVAAAGPSLEEMRAAFEVAATLDRELAEKYGATEDVGA